MAFIILGSVVLGVLWGIRARPLPPMIRRGVPGVAVLAGLISLRVSINTIGSAAVQSGQLDPIGLMGICLMIFGLFALLFLVVGHITNELRTSARLSRRK